VRLSADAAEDDVAIGVGARHTAGAGADRLDLTASLHTPDAASVLSSLAALYVQEPRLADARPTLDRAQDILQRSEGTVPMDRLKLLAVRAAIHFLESDFQMAEQDARESLAIAEGEPQLSASYRAILLSDYARILRKNHRNQEAHSMETRASALRRDTGIASVIDVSELSGGSSSKH
jgi:hypothetical protein